MIKEKAKRNQICKWERKGEDERYERGKSGVRRKGIGKERKN